MSKNTVRHREFGSVAAPEDLAVTLERQVACLLDIGAAAQAKVAKGKYCDQLMAAVAAFSWREDWATIGLNRVALVDFRLSGQFLAEAGGVTCGITPDACTLYQGVTIPDGTLVIQGQWGVKYRNKKPRWCRDNFNPLEQGLTVKERLTVHLYEGECLREAYTDCPGSVSPGGSVPYLNLWFDRPRLYVFLDGDANPNFGSGSRGKQGFLPWNLDPWVRVIRLGGSPFSFAQHCVQCVRKYPFPGYGLGWRNRKRLFVTVVGYG